MDAAPGKEIPAGGAASLPLGQIPSNMKQKEVSPSIRFLLGRSLSDKNVALIHTYFITLSPAIGLG